MTLFLWLGDVRALKKTSLFRQPAGCEKGDDKMINFLDQLDSFIWGPPLLVLLVGTFD